MNVKRYFKLHTHIVVIFLVFLQQWTKILQKTNCYEEFHLIFGFSFEIGQNIPRSIISITEGWSIDRPSVAFRMESYCQWWMQQKIEQCLGNATEIFVNYLSVDVLTKQVAEFVMIEDVEELQCVPLLLQNSMNWTLIWRKIDVNTITWTTDKIHCNSE